MTHQPTILAAGVALVIATTVMVAAVASQNLRFGGSPATRSVPTSPQQVERALAQVRAGEHEGLTRGWATGQGQATTGYPLPDKRDGHVGLTELAAGGITSAPAIAPNLPAGNWGLSEVRPNGSTSANGAQILIRANQYAPGVPSVPVLKSSHTTDAALSADSPSYSELVNQRRGEKDRITKSEQPDAYNLAGFSIR